MKDAAQGDVLRAIRSVGRNEAVFSPSVASRILESLAAVQSSTLFPVRFPTLTERERDILSKARGCDNAEITRQFDLTPKTVRNQVSAMLSKLQVVDRTEAIIQSARSWPGPLNGNTAAAASGLGRARGRA